LSRGWGTPDKHSIEPTLPCVRPTRVDHYSLVLRLTAPWRFDSSPYSDFSCERLASQRLVRRSCFSWSQSWLRIKKCPACYRAITCCIILLSTTPFPAAPGHIKYFPGIFHANSKGPAKRSKYRLEPNLFISLSNGGCPGYM
jgi:hypothetical protein